jgi:hypothetical protein
VATSSGPPELPTPKRNLPVRDRETLANATVTPPGAGATSGRLGVTEGVLVRGAGCSSPQLVVGHVRRVAHHALERDLRERLVGRVTGKLREIIRKLRDAG